MLSYSISSRYQDGTRMVTGRYQQSFYQQLCNRIDELIRDKGVLNIDEGYYLNYSDLDHDEKGELIALQLEDNDRDTYSCFHEEDQFPIDDNITCAFLKLLKHDTSDNREDLIQSILKNTFKSYEKRLQELIDDRCGWVYKDWIDNAGFDE